MAADNGGRVMAEHGESADRDQAPDLLQAETPKGAGTPEGAAAPKGAETPERAAAPEGAETPERAAAPGGGLPADVHRIVDGGGPRATRWGRLQAVARAALTSPPAKEEERLDGELRRLRMRERRHGVTVALGSIKGGVGKTTLALALADTLVEALRCGVLVLDADLEWGTAADSAPRDGAAGRTLGDLLAARERIDSLGDLAPFLVALPGGARLLAGPTRPQEIKNLTAEDMQTLLELLRRFFPVILIDLSPGIGLRGTVPRWAFGVADEIVAIATPTPGSLRRAGRMLAYLADWRPEVPVTLALNMVPRRPDESVRRIVEVAERDGAMRRYAAIPRDDGLIRQLDAGLFDLAALQQRTRIAIKDLTLSMAGEWCR